MEETDLLQQESPSNSNHSSSNLNYNPPITGHLSEEELKWAQEIISLAKSGAILGGELPKSPLNSNEVSPVITEIQGKQITMLESPQPRSPNYASKIDIEQRL
ncbi:hypothetical protein H5410_047195 [Solanum commersonii]|uniref:Uncharacterized protein n=1 Tax=Solanum commersonii TaxID=4109 RepID=A0A9J5XED5_SOLCO|nr:hypothetical protein H5410_047195 [Solanum commersonii]